LTWIKSGLLRQRSVHLIQVKDNHGRFGIIFREQETSHASRFDICRCSRNRDVPYLRLRPRLGRLADPAEAPGVLSPLGTRKMTIPSNDMPKSPRRSGWAGWIRAVASRFVSNGGLQELDRTEFAQIARDLNLSPAELHAISIGSGRSARLLSKRMMEFGLLPEVVKKQHPEVSRDLERVCGMCSSKRRCARERGPDLALSDYCPNTQTLRALQGERAVEQRTLPIGPACC
jgi:hypothetical protein